MAEYTEKRLFRRVDYQTSNMVYKKDANDTYTAATMSNYSQGGMYMKSSEPMTVGKHVIIKMEDYDPNHSGPERYDYYYGQIRWIKNFKADVGDPYYGYGIEFDQVVYYE